MTIYELYGRLMEERQREHEAHVRTIAVLRQVVAGELAPERLIVTETGWTVKPETATVHALKVVGD